MLNINENIKNNNIPQIAKLYFLLNIVSTIRCYTFQNFPTNATSPSPDSAVIKNPKIGLEGLIEEKKIVPLLYKKIAKNQTL